MIRAMPRCGRASRSASAPFLGLDFRYTELQAALLLAQLRKLPGLIDRLTDQKAAF